MLADLPVEVLLDNVLPVLALPDVLRLGCTSRFFAELTNDGSHACRRSSLPSDLAVLDTFWKRKLQLDFNFSGHGTARTSGWKFIYRGLSNPRAFVWGCVRHW
jgi:SCF-associated factor 1